MKYDVLGHMIERRENSTSPTHTWTYDTAPGKGVGKLAKVTGPDGYEKTLSYTGLGQLASMTETIPNNPNGSGGTSSYTMHNSYDGFSRLDVVSYPSGNTAKPVRVKHHYNVYGILTHITDLANGQNHWEANTADADGQITKQTLGNNVVTIRDYDTNGRLNTITSGIGGGVGLQNLKYDWDDVGNLQSRADLGEGLNESYGYDNLYRLNAINKTYKNKLTDQTTINASPETITYDGHGNIRQKDGFTYKYIGYGPHAVSEKGGVAYTYDDNGNMLSGGGRTQDWTAFNKPSRIQKGTTTTINLAYNVDRARMLKRNNNDETTWYFASLYERTHKADGAEVHKYHLIAGKQVIGYIAQHKQTTGAWGSVNTRYLLKDHLNSIDRVVDAGGADKGNLSFSAWGKRRTESWAPVTASVNFLSLLRDIETDAVKLGFTGHEMDDDAGLVNMKGRLYDADLGRFISADPNIQAPGDTQSYNRYSYVKNNPLSYTDPSGYFFKKLFKSTIFRVIVAVVLAYFTGGAAVGALNLTGTFAGAVVGGAVGGFTAGFVITGTLSGAIKGGLFGAISGGLAYGVGHGAGMKEFWAGMGDAGTAAKAVAHGVTQGGVQYYGVLSLRMVLSVHLHHQYLRHL